MTPLFDTYEVRVRSTIPGAGRGVFARRDIKAGEEILWEKPIVSDPTEKQRAEDLSAADRTVIKANLIGAGGSTNDTPLSTAQLKSICKNNSFAFAGLCLVASMFNHACSANASFEFDETRRCQVIYAIVPIKAGDEIFVSYLGDLESSKKRQLKLALVRGFQCGCALCTAEPAKVRRIDAALDELHALRDQMLDPFKHGAIESVGERVRELCEMLLSLEFNISGIHRLYAMTMQEIFSICAQQDVVHSSNPERNPAIFNRCLKWLDRYLALMADEAYGDVPPNSAVWIGKLKKHEHFKKDPTKFIGCIRSGTFPRFMNSP